MKPIEELVKGYEYAGSVSELTHADRADLFREAIQWMHNENDAILDIFPTEGDLAFFTLYASEAAKWEDYAEGHPSEGTHAARDKAMMRLASFVTDRCRRTLSRRLGAALYEQHAARMDDEPTFAEEAADLCRMDYADRFAGVKA